MSWTPVGHCPKCGAPMYVPMVWHGVQPPSPQRTCGCFPSRTITTNTTNVYSKEA